jgi:hypothetical protein
MEIPMLRRLEPLLGVADHRDRGAELGGATLLRQVARFDDCEAGGANIRVADHSGRQPGEGRVCLDGVADLFPDGACADAEQDMLASTRTAVVLREEILQDVIGGLPRMASVVINIAMQPKPSGRIFEQVKDVTAVT